MTGMGMVFRRLSTIIAVLGNKQSQKLIDNILVLFNSTYEQLEGESLRHLMVSVIKTAYLINMHYSSHTKKKTLKISRLKAVKENRIRLFLIWFNLRV